MTDVFARVRDTIMRVFPQARLVPVGEEEVAAIRSQFPDAPEHYLEFLRQVGYGSLGDNFMLYSGLCAPDDIFDTETATDLAGVVFLGDNFAGWMVGFDTRNGWQLVGVDSSSLTPEPEPAKTVADFVAQRLSEYESA